MFGELMEISRRRVVHNWLRYCNPDLPHNEFGKSGLAIAEVFSDAAGPGYRPGSPEFAVAARQR